jgi:hypothetical protein
MFSAASRSIQSVNGPGQTTSVKTPGGVQAGGT